MVLKILARLATKAGLDHFLEEDIEEEEDPIDDEIEIWRYEQRLKWGYK